MMKTKEINLLESIYKPTFRTDTNSGIRRLSFQQSLRAMFLLVLIILTGCTHNPSSNILTDPGDAPASKEGSHLVTFIELGSVRCIPCQKMQPIMRSIEEKYGTQVKVVFHDVWTEEGRPFADQYAIELIPTQVFLDKDGKEFFRHQGFFEETELIKVLETKGVHL